MPLTRSGVISARQWNWHFPHWAIGPESDVNSLSALVECDSEAIAIVGNVEQSHRVSCGWGQKFDEDGVVARIVPTADAGAGHDPLVAGICLCGMNEVVIRYQLSIAVEFVHVVKRFDKKISRACMIVGTIDVSYPAHTEEETTPPRLQVNMKAFLH